MEALQRLHNRGSVSTGFDIDNSCKFQRDGEYLKAEGRSQGTQTTWTYSTWVKRTDLSDTNEPYQNFFSAGSSSSNWCHAYFRGDGSYPDNQIFLYLDNGGSQYWLGRIQESFRDTAAWYHFVLAVDTTQSTAADRAKVYINGVQKTISNFTAPTQNASTRVGDNGGKFAIGGLTDASHSFNGYIAECVLVDGSQLAPTSFGEFDDDSGIWKAKDVSALSLGTTGFYINFDDSSNMGKVTSGNNGGNFDKYGIDSSNQATDTPTNNFCTWSPLWTFSKTRTLSEGGTNADGSSSWGGVKGTIGVTNGKWYWENKASGTDTIVGWQTENCVHESNEESMHNIKDTMGFYTGGNYVWVRDETSGRNDASTTGSNASGQIIGMALDLDSSPQTATFYRNGSAVSSALNIDGLTGKTIFPFLSQYNYNAESNFGGFCTYTISSAATDANGYGTFEYAPPSGYYAICTKNLEEFG